MFSIYAASDTKDLSFSPCFVEHENKLCEVTADTCDTESTNCKQRNGSTFCECKHPGFTAYDYEVNFCKGTYQAKVFLILGH